MWYVENICKERHDEDLSIKGGDSTWEIKNMEEYSEGPFRVLGPEHTGE